jgi:dynein heavy chain
LGAQSDWAGRWQGFLTGALQKHARKHVIAIDHLEFGFVVTKFFTDEELEGAPEDGCYVSGLFIEAARWDMETMTLQPPELGANQSVLPYIHFLPSEDCELPLTDYQCPVYRTNIRAGVLTTTGASSNYVCDLSLPTGGRDPAFFVLQVPASLARPCRPYRLHAPSHPPPPSLRSHRLIPPLHLAVGHRRHHDAQRLELLRFIH